MAAIFTDEQITPDDSTAVATDNAKTTSGGKTAQKMLVTVTEADARMRVGANPTVSVGILLKVTTDKPYEFSGFDLIDDTRFISTASAGSIIDVQYTLL